MTPASYSLALAPGCGELPQGLEMVVKLMVPGELALANADASPGGHYAYQGRDDWPPGLAEALASNAPGSTGETHGGSSGGSSRGQGASSSGRVEWEVELVDFEREGFWQVRQRPVTGVPSLCVHVSVMTCLACCVSVKAFFDGMSGTASALFLWPWHPR